MPAHAASAAAARAHPAPGPLHVRRISARNYIPLDLLAIGIGAGIWLAGQRGLIPLASPWLELAALAPLLLVLLYAWIATRSEQYRVFPDSLEVRRGIVARRIENLQLFRVRDVSLRQGLLGRLAGVGDITVRSTDDTTPVVTLRGVGRPLELYESLRRLVADETARRTVMVERDTSPGPAAPGRS